MDILDKIDKLEQHYAQGTLSEAEFKSAKEKLLNQEPKFSSTSDGASIYGVEEKTWCALMHLSQLLYFSGVGIVLPIAMFLLGSNQSDLVRRHGHRMMNWIISTVIYAAIGGLLCFLFIGIPLLIILMLLAIAFPIIAAVKANQGEVWTYPLTIKIFDED